MDTLPISEARKLLSQIARDFREQPEKRAVALTVNGIPEMALMPWDLFEALFETLEIISDEEQMKELRQAMKDLKEGKTRSLAEFEAELGL